MTPPPMHQLLHGLKLILYAMTTSPPAGDAGDMLAYDSQRCPASSTDGIGCP